MDATQRFSDRVAAYVRGRPGYPAEILSTLPLQPEHVVADLGSGTGILSRLFLDAGHTVYGVEPNEAMRGAAPPHERFYSLAGKAEATTLPDRSVDVAVAGQAFHWFDPDLTRVELGRILRGPRLVALVWNDRNHESPLERAVLDLMEEFAPDFRRLRTDRSGDPFVDRFMPTQKATFAGYQDLDGEAFRARLHSCSCLPGPGEPRHEELEGRIAALFTRHQRDGCVRLTHTTRLYWGTFQDTSGQGGNQSRPIPARRTAV